MSRVLTSTKFFHGLAGRVGYGERQNTSRLGKRLRQSWLSIIRPNPIGLSILSD